MITQGASVGLDKVYKSSYCTLRYIISLADSSLARCVRLLVTSLVPAKIEVFDIHAFLVNDHEGAISGDHHLSTIMMLNKGIIQK